MKLRISLVIACCAVSIVIGLIIARGGASGTAGRQVAHTPLIGFSMDTLKEERWQRDRTSFVERARQLGAEVLVQSANSDDTHQISDIQALISRKVDVLVIVPHNGAAMAKGVDMAHEAGIPVIAYDRLITGCDLDLYVTFDNVKVGELQARYLIDHLPDANPIRLVRIYGAKTDNNARLYKEGQDKVLAPLIKSGRVKVVHEDWAEDWRPENAKKIMNAAITTSHHEIDAVLASNDGTAGGAIQALMEEGIAGEVLVTGQDAEQSACQRIVNDTQAMTVYKPVATLAAKAAATAYAFAKGKPVIAKAVTPNGKADVPTILVDVVVATKDNMMATVVKDGFHSREQVYQQTAADASQ
jgi:D-xylose transport system substrate-binding protein